jgi:hypothetical protein
MAVSIYRGAHLPYLPEGAGKVCLGA